MDDLIKRLRKRGLGCYILGLFVACLLYADDLCLITPSRGSMQELLLICENYCEEFCLSFNAKKSKALIFGSRRNEFSESLYLDQQPIEYVSEWGYLGTTIVAGKSLSFSHTKDLRSFYRSINTVLSAIHKPNELVQMFLLYTLSVPILTYAAEVKVFKHSDMMSCNTALNNAIRRIFSFHRWESPRELREQLEYPGLYDIFLSRSLRFKKKCQNSSNGVIAFLTNKLT